MLLKCSVTVSMLALWMGKHFHPSVAVTTELTPSASVNAWYNGLVVSNVDAMKTALVTKEFDAGYWILDTGHWILDARYSILDTGYWTLDTAHFGLATNLTPKQPLTEHPEKSGQDLPIDCPLPTVELKD